MCVGVRRLGGVWMLLTVVTCYGAWAAPKPASADPVVDEINRQLRASWGELDLSPSEAATDGEWCRRVYLDLVGRVPKVDELDQFTSDRRADRRERLVRNLLHGGDHTKEFTRHWATYWLNLWIGRDAATGGDGAVDGAGLRAYVEESLAEAKPYNQLVYELLAAEGTNVAGTEGHNGAVNFLAGKLEDNAVQATSDVARMMLGVQVQCTQCHDHPFNDWKQDQFWGLNSFFRQTVALRRPSLEGDGRLRAIELTDQDFPGENRRSPTPEQAEVYFELRNGDLKSAYPTFLDGTVIDPSGYVDEVHRRQELAQLVSTSDLLAEALVNRMWGYFLGYGFTTPVDDMGPHNRPSHPELLSYLAGQVRSSGYDLRRLMEWIVLSEPYGLSSRMARGGTIDRPALGRVPRFSRFYLRQMQPEQVYDSLVLLGPVAESSQQRESADERRRRWLSRFTIDLGTDDGGEATTFDGTIPQMLMMFNGELTRDATVCEPGTFLGQVWADPELSTVAKVQKLYRSALGRPAGRRELQLHARWMYGSGAAQREAFEDLWWALLNSNEFILIH